MDCKRWLITRLANVYLPPVKTIDTFFLRQIMKGEKRVRRACGSSTPQAS
jgi:hypothetical protein